MTKTLIIIPSRLAAVRFPNKPLALINGKPMVLHVYERALESKLGPVVVACCGQEIKNLIESQGGTAIITDPNLPSGTDRVHAVASIFDPQKEYEAIVNLQGDLPFMNGDDLSKVTLPLKDSAYSMGTLASLIHEKEDLHNPNIVKIALSIKESAPMGNALYFSRSLIPSQGTTHYHHIGVYSYTRKALEGFVSLPPSGLELNEKLEQLRALEAGMKIGVVVVPNTPVSVDHPDDLKKLT